MCHVTSYKLPFSSLAYFIVYCDTWLAKGNKLFLFVLHVAYVKKKVFNNNSYNGKGNC
jgi:hypothetical protein